SLSVKDPIREAGRLVEEGYIVAIKGNGGFHLAASTTKSDPITKLRRIKHRAQKPFSVMSPNIDVIKSFAEVNRIEETLLSSLSRPIVLLKKRDEYYLSELVSPQLHTIGVMLPYSGLHYLLFDNVTEPAFIMTSANAPSEPIVIDNDEALKKLATTADFMLFHNRAIAQRCDDSVVRVHGEDTSFIRRSKGYAPSPIVLTRERKSCTLGVGAEENVNSCLILGNKAFISQYVGDVERLETFQFQKETARHLLFITKGNVDGIGCDLHPQFATTKLAKQFAAEFDCPVFQVQHHYAHALSLMEERSVDEMIGIICDGTGYGPDGISWGGEILRCSGKEFTRLGHLKEQPMPGGDLSAKYPLRMVAGILGSTIEARKLLVSKATHFPHREMEVEVIFEQIENARMPLTSSCGRVLDAVAALLGLCYERTYEGEPAMKLESAARGGTDALKLEPRIESGVIDTTYLLQQVSQNLNKNLIKDLAYSAEKYLAEGLAMLALDQSHRTGITAIGLSGGVAYNEHITASIRETLEEGGRRLLVHNRVPAGDGGIAFGQSIAANNSL
ncbi:carbamoyltransferase HypF, partial [Candidatus Bathyarchaeota archaeon]|nr:carbamoyltransferase HypF [Candidatus Bathyarchaeota archaeon]